MVFGTKGAEVEQDKLLTVPHFLQLALDGPLEGLNVVRCWPVFLVGGHQGEAARLVDGPSGFDAIGEDDGPADHGAGANEAVYFDADVASAHGGWFRFEIGKFVDVGLTLGRERRRGGCCGVEGFLGLNQVEAEVNEQEANVDISEF